MIIYLCFKCSLWKNFTDQQANPSGAAASRDGCLAASVGAQNPFERLQKVTAVLQMGFVLLHEDGGHQHLVRDRQMAFTCSGPTSFALCLWCRGIILGQLLAVK